MRRALAAARRRLALEDKGGCRVVFLSWFRLEQRRGLLQLNFTVRSSGGRPRVDVTVPPKNC